MRHPPLAAPGEVGDLADAIYRLSEQLEARLSALVAEQSILSALVETLNEGVLAISPEHEVVRINDTGRRLLSINVRSIGRTFPRENRSGAIHGR